MIHENVLVAIKTLAENIDNFNVGVDVKDAEALHTVLDANDDDTLFGHLGECVEALWKDEAIQIMRVPAASLRVRAKRQTRRRWSHRSSLQVIESVVYFFDKMHELKDDTWIPSTQDILNARVRTSATPASPPAR